MDKTTTTSTTSASTTTASTTSRIAGEEGAESSHPPLSQSKLCDSFMEVGSRLFSSCPDLFSNALTQLSNQLSLALVKNPNVLRPAASSNDDNNSTTEAVSEVALTQKSKKSSKSTSSATSKHTPFRKYVLPKDAPPEYYQCMDCGERRPENSFQNDHMHFGKKPKVRWYCPLCKTFFAVTHRSGHIKCRHPSSEASSPANSPLCSSPETCSNNNATPVKRLDRNNEVTVVSSSTTSSPRNDFDSIIAATTTKGTLVMAPPPPPPEPKAVSAVREEEEDEEEEDEEGFEVPAQKRACLFSDAGDEPSPLFSSSINEDAFSTTADEDICPPAVRVPSTPAVYATTAATTTSATSCCFETVEDLPAFRCPSYVLMPDSTTTSSTSEIDPSGSGLVLYF